MNVTLMTATVYAFNKALDQQSLILDILNGIPTPADASSSLQSPAAVTENQPVPSDPNATGQIIDVVT